MTTRNDVHIAVIGLSGEDKSEFIRLCIGEETGVASKIRGWITQSSYAKQIQASPFTHQGQRIHLIDTPGLNEFDTARGYINLRKLLKEVGRVYQNGVELDGIILLLSLAEDPATRLENQDFIFVERCNEKHLSRIVLATTWWDFVSPKKSLVYESRLKRIAQNLSKTRFGDGDYIRLYHTKQSCVAALDVLLQQINSESQDRSVEQTAKHQGEIGASKQKKASSKKAQTTDETEEKRHRSDHAAATKYEEEITALKQQILKLEEANHALNVESLERYFTALVVLTTEAARTQEYENQIASLKAELDERTKEVTAMKAYIAEAERTATGYWGDVEIPPIPYSLEPPRQASD